MLDSQSRSRATKDDVRDFWDAASCGETYAGDNSDAGMLRSYKIRYLLEPYIPTFAKFETGEGKDVLEIGVGMGADHLRWAQSQPRLLCGIDLTPRAIEWTRKRLALGKLNSKLQVADAENLPFPDASFDIVYSWGVLHHSPNTRKAFSEAARVLRPGGTARIMIYHTRSLTGFMLWARYSAKERRLLSLRHVYSTYLESPGTKAYTVAEAKALCRDAGFSKVVTKVQLGTGDLLLGAAGQRHQGRMLSLVKAIWPRPLFRLFTPGLGLFLMIEAKH